MVYYSLEGDGKGTIKFWTDNKEIEEDIIRYITNVIDATKWRNQIIAVKPKEDRK